ncbi:membrane protein [Cuniculiplasma divulgatum]|jgi:uncharacterized membrane protein|uniref:Membrane protein n=2 Tax=Cuniculiplasma divulgatum TaxID=1673428 RepID=A0A1N5S3J3_9ARCH|nr:membrane protein [Cuniculiplasma divulgatum]
MAQKLSQREYFIISTSFAALGLVALTAGLYYFFGYVSSSSVSNIVFYSALWIVGVLVLLRRYSKRRPSKGNNQ